MPIKANIESYQTLFSVSNSISCMVSGSRVPTAKFAPNNPACCHSRRFLGRSQSMILNSVGLDARLSLVLLVDLRQDAQELTVLIRFSDRLGAKVVLQVLNELWLVIDLIWKTVLHLLRLHLSDQANSNGLHFQNQNLFVSFIRCFHLASLLFI